MLFFLTFLIIFGFCTVAFLSGFMIIVGLNEFHNYPFASILLFICAISAIGLAVFVMIESVDMVNKKYKQSCIVQQINIA